MAKTLDDLNDLINDRRRDSGSNSIDMTTTGFRAITSTIELMVSIHNWEWQIKKTTINFHKGITWYADVADFKAPIDLRYQRTPNRNSEFDLVSPNNFDSQTLKTRRFAVSTQTSEQYIRVEGSGETIQVHTATEFDGDGTWVAAGHCSNITTDSYEHYDLTGSINFDFDGTSGTITVDDMTDKDLSKYVDRSKIYMNVDLPTVTSFTSVQMKIGNDSSNYYTATPTTNYLGESVATGWNKFEFDVWDSKTGTPDPEHLDWIEITIKYSGSTTDTDFRIENIFCSEDVPLDLIYYSLYMVYDTSASVWVQNFNDSSETTDYPLWSGRFDWVTEGFIDACLETIFLITGETEDYAIAEKRRLEILNNLKRKLPSRRRFPELQFEVE